MLAAVILTGHVDSVMINSMKIHHNDILLIDTWCLSFAVENVITSRSPSRTEKIVAVFSVVIFEIYEISLKTILPKIFTIATSVDTV